MKVDDELLTIFQNYLPGYYYEFQPYQFVFYVLAQPYLLNCHRQIKLLAL